MSYKLLRTEQVEIQLLNIVDYVMDQSGSAEIAEKLLNKIETAMETLKEYPNRCPVPRNAVLRKRGYRVLMVGSYMIFYLCDNTQKEVSVIGITHFRADYASTIIA